MAYTKVDWNEQTPLSESNMDQMETIYDEIIDEITQERADGTKPLCFEARYSYPSGTIALGRVFVHVSLEKALIYIGSGNWATIAEVGDTTL